jgi:hypothetical protein
LLLYKIEFGLDGFWDERLDNNLDVHGSEPGVLCVRNTAAPPEFAACVDRAHTAAQHGFPSRQLSQLNLCGWIRI